MPAIPESLPTQVMALAPLESGRPARACKMMSSSGSNLIVVLGTGRCGSTMVEEVLCRHPAVGFVSNLQDRIPLPIGLGRWNGALYRRLPAAATRKGQLRFAPSEAYRALGREVSTLISNPCRELESRDVEPWLEHRLRSFFLEHARTQPADAFLHKFTGWPRVGLLQRVFPEIRFIHVVRDGRAVANSWLQMPWWLGYGGPQRWQWGPLPTELAVEWDASGRSFVVLAGLLWAMLIDAFDRARSAVPSARWLEIRYEEIISAPQTTFAAMLDFCGLSWNDGFERGYKRHQFERSRAEAYRSDLRSADVERLTAYLADRLTAHGYDAI